jgi:hypothetical protein
LKIAIRVKLVSVGGNGKHSMLCDCK